MVRLHSVGTWSPGNGEASKANSQALSSTHSLLDPKITSYSFLWRHAAVVPKFRPPSLRRPTLLYLVTGHVRRGIPDVSEWSLILQSRCLEVPEELNFLLP